MLQTSAIRRTAVAALAMTLSVGLMACNQPKTPVANAVTSVTVAPKTLALNTTTAKTGQITATVAVTGTAAKTVSFTSSNNNVATVAAGTTAGTATVTAVAAGTATINVCSTVTGFTAKCDTVSVTVTGTTGGTTPTPAFKVNFQPATTATPAGPAVPTGYTGDFGAAFNGTSGWVNEAAAANPTVATALDMTSAARYRNDSFTAPGLSDEQKTAILMDCGDVPAGTSVCSGSTQKGPGAWVYKVNNGKYDVTVSVGDADTRNTNSSHVINVEGVNVIAATTPTAGTLVTGSKTSITVSDGFLSVDSVGGQNTKINYITVTPSAVQ